MNNTKDPAGVAMPTSGPPTAEKVDNREGVDLNSEFQATCTINGTRGQHDEGWEEPQTTPRGIASVGAPHAHREETPT